jgi:uncharacterized membrane protein
VSRRLWSVLFGGTGLLVSLYLTLVRYSDGQLTLACPSSGFINCEDVTSSAESMLGAVPVALLGTIWFAVALAMLLPRVPPAPRLAWTAGGLVFVFYLVYVEMFLIGALCLWCTVVHAAVAGLFLLTIADLTDEPIRRSQAPR